MEDFGGRKMKHEYEIIFHEKINYKIFVVSLIYRTPHIHKDFEIGLLLDGDAALIMPERTACGKSRHIRAESFPKT